MIKASTALLIYFACSWVMAWCLVRLYPRTPIEELTNASTPAYVLAGFLILSSLGGLLAAGVMLIIVVLR